MFDDTLNGDDGVVLHHDYPEGRWMSLSGLFGATATILTTTLVDSIWLVPFTVSASTYTIRLVHAFLYVGTFTCLTTIICVVTYLLQYYSMKAMIDTATSTTLQDTLSFYSSIAGAIICWLLGFYFYWKSLRKRRRREQQQQQQEQQLQQQQLQQLPEVEDEEIEFQTLTLKSQLLSLSENPLAETLTGNDYQKLDSRDITYPDNELPVPLENDDQPKDEENYQTNNDQTENNINDDNDSQITRIHAMTVITLTMIGSLDEVCYYPSLLLGHIFTPCEIVIGTAMAALIELFILYFFLSSCQPILHLLKQIPTYAVIFFLAIVLSGEVIWEEIFE